MIQINCTSNVEKGFVRSMLEVMTTAKISVDEDVAVMGPTEIVVTCEESGDEEKYLFSLTEKDPRHYNVDDAVDGDNTDVAPETEEGE